MENCLVKKYKAVVNNDNLPIFNAIKIKVNNPSVVSNGYLVTAVIGSISTTNNKKLYPSYNDAVNDTNGFTSKTTTTSGNNDLYLSAGEYYIIVKPKNEIRRFTCNYQFAGTLDFGDFADFSQLTNLFELNIPTNRIKGDIANLKDSTNLQTLTLQGNSEVNGSISDISELTKLQTLNLISTNVGGSVDSLGKLTVLTTLVLTDCGVGGDLATMANAMVSSPNNRTFGTLTVTCNNSVKLNGTVIPRRGTVVIKFGTSMENPTAEDTERGWQSIVS